MKDWLIDGKAAQSIAVTDRGFTYGDGLFETIAIRNGQPRFFTRHLDRLQDGANRLGIALPDRNTLRNETTTVATGCEYGSVKIILTRGSGPRGYALPAKVRPSRLIGIYSGQPPARHLYAEGITVRYCRTPVAVNPTTAGIKTLGRLEQVLARAEWQDADIHEGLMSTVDGNIICGTMSNLFAVLNGQLITPDLSRSGIRGIMRSIVLETAIELGLVVSEINVTREILAQAEEWFVTNSQIGIWPVRCLDRKSLAIGPVTVLLMQALAERGVQECARS